MRKNKQSTRSLIAFIVTWAFVVLTVTGIVLYIVPQGRVAYWVHWSLAGMEKEQWGWIHMMFGGVFIISGFLHLFYNWQPFKKYVADRVKGHIKPKQEIFIATAITIAIIAVSALNIPPASWIIDLNSWIKGTWVTSPELEPPFGHAEESSLAGIAKKMNIDVEKAMQELESNGIEFTGKKDTLENISRLNNTTPMYIYGLILRHKMSSSIEDIKLITAEDIEAKYSGTGLGRKSLAEICLEIEIDLGTGLDKLSNAGISASGDDVARDIAEKYSRSPIDLLVIMVQP